MLICIYKKEIITEKYDKTDNSRQLPSYIFTAYN